MIAERQCLGHLVGCVYVSPLNAHMLSTDVAMSIRAVGLGMICRRLAHGARAHRSMRGLELAEAAAARVQGMLAPTSFVGSRSPDSPTFIVADHQVAGIVDMDVRARY